MTDDEREGLALTDDELDRLVAEKVCGWTLVPAAGGGKGWVTPSGVVNQDGFLPSTDLNDTVRALNEARRPKLRFHVEAGDSHSALVWPDGESFLASREHLADTEPATIARALCLAALRAKGVEV